MNEQEVRLEFFTGTYNAELGDYLKREINKWQWSDPRLSRSIKGSQIAIHGLSCFCMVTYTEKKRTDTEIINLAKAYLRANPKADVELLIDTLNFPKNLAEKAFKIVYEGDDL